MLTGDWIIKRLYDQSITPSKPACEGRQGHAEAGSEGPAPSRHLCVQHAARATERWAIELVMPSNHLILCHRLLLLPSVFPSIRVFSSESALCIRWPKYWRFSFSISPSNEYSGLIYFRMDWLDLLAGQTPSQSSK